MKTTAQSSGALQAQNGESILIIESSAKDAKALKVTLESAGYNSEVVNNLEQALETLAQQDFETVIYTLSDSPDTGEHPAKLIREHTQRVNLIQVSCASEPEEAIQAIKSGADEFLEKPIAEIDLLLSVQKAKERNRLRNDNELLRSQVAKRYSFSRIIAKSPQMLEIFETIKKVSEYRTTVMLYGDSGTGKELIAKAIHHNSNRKNKRFVAINCGAIPENLLESELFGHKRGAFTDATRDKKGLFEEAEGGTILLDEIGELPVHLQVKLLRVLQEQEIRPVGEAKSTPIDVRVIAATLRDLEADVLEGRFRDDLYYRLNVISLRIPPLRERKEDIPLLVNFFIKRNQEKLGLPVYGINKDATAALIDHEWPGNIRELENCIERAMILTESDEITLESLPKTVHLADAQKNEARQMLLDDELSIKQHTRAIEEVLIKKALGKTKGNRTHAAKLLEISHRTLLYKLKQYKLTEEGAAK